MSDSKDEETTLLAKRIVDLREKKNKPNPDCTICRGKGEFNQFVGIDDEKHAMYVNTVCLCSQRLDRNVPVIRLTEYDDTLLLMAKHYLKDP
jgi:hypothetical protein